MYGVLGCIVMDSNFLEQFINCRVRIIQKDFYTKVGIFKGYDEYSIYLEFFDGSPQVIGRDNITTLQKLEERE